MDQSNTIQNTCSHIFTKGARKGERCKVKPRGNRSNFCSRHGSIVTNHQLNSTSLSESFETTSFDTLPPTGGIGIICMNPNLISEINNIIGTMISNGYDNDYIIQYINENVSCARAIAFSNEFTQAFNNYIPSSVYDEINSAHFSESNKLTIQDRSYYQINDDSTCAICLGDIFPQTEVNGNASCNNGVVTKCLHSFHKECLEECFLKTKQLKCPICRKQQINIDLRYAIPEANCKKFVQPSK